MWDEFNDGSLQIQNSKELQLRFHSKTRQDPLSVMDTNELALLKLFIVGILVSTWMMKGLSATDIEPTPPRTRKTCNESHLQWEVEDCGEDFKQKMAHIDRQYYCNLTHFISEYHFFTLCTETKSHIVNCYWPNPLVEKYIIHIHKHFFSNCSTQQVVWKDPPDNTLILLIFVPVFLTLAMIAVVVWCSKRSDILA